MYKVWSILASDHLVAPTVRGTFPIRSPAAHSTSAKATRTGTTQHTHIKIQMKAQAGIPHIVMCAWVGGGQMVPGRACPTVAVGGGGMGQGINSSSVKGIMIGPLLASSSRKEVIDREDNPRILVRREATSSR